MSADNGIGTAGRLHAVDEETTQESDNGIAWPKGKVPLPRIKKAPETSRNRLNFRSIVSTIGEIGGIAGISAGAWWFSPGIGLITAGIGVFAISFAAGMPE